MRARPITAAFAVFTFFASAAPVLAQRTGSLIGPAPAEIPDTGFIAKDELGRIVMYRFAECVVSASRKRVETYLRDNFPGSPAAHKSAASLSTDDCLSDGRMRLNESLFRGGAYEVLYRRKFLIRGPMDFSATQPLDYGAGLGPEWTVQEKRAVAMRHLADCTVRAAPPQARTLILSAVGGKAETEAFTQLAPKMSACLFEGSQLNFSKAMFRGAVGEALYRLSMAAETTAGAVR